MNGEIKVVDDVAIAFADMVEQQKQADPYSIAISGGSSAEPCYTELAKRNIDWANVSIYWADERCVPLDDPMSNAGNAKRLFIDQLRPSPEVFPMVCNDGPEAYQALLKANGVIDLVHLGVGPDGHTASLFPRSDALSATDELVVKSVDPTGNNPLKRMTLTYAGIAYSKQIVFTLIGESKAPVLKQLVDGVDLPAAKVTGASVIYLVDKAAASLLD